MVVTGVGVVSALGSDASFWDGLCAGASGIAPAEGFDPGPGAPRLIARARSFDARQHVAPALLRRMDRFSQMVVTATRSALADARLVFTDATAEAAGVVVGTAYGNLSESEDFLRALFAKGPARANPLTFPNLVLNAPTGYVAIDLGLRGPNFTVACGEASGERALALAYDTLASGQADVLLAGGGDEIAPVLFHIHKDLGVLSPAAGKRRARRPLDPEAERSSPFDRDRNGFVMGEGAAMLVLERAEHAAARGATLYAELVGYAAESVAASPHDWPRPRAGATTVTAQQLATLGWEYPGPRDLVLSCANSTPALDAFEAARLARLLGEAARSTLVTSIKGGIGEFGGAGALTAAAAALALQTGRLPRLGALGAQDPRCALRLATREVDDPAGGLRHAVVSCTPRGGACLALLFRSLS